MSVEGSDRQPRKKKWMIVCVVVACVISGAGWLRLRADSSMEPMLPENSPARQTILFFRDSSFADKAVLWFRLTGNGSTNDLFAAADATEKRLDPHIISQVIRAPNESSAMDQALGMLDHAGELLNETDLGDIEKATAPDALSKRMRDCYMQLVKPSGSFLQQIFRRDPLGVTSRILTRLYALTNGMGYRMQVKDGHVINADGRQLIMVLETSTTATNLASSKAMVAHLQSLCAAAPPGISITPICGQIHTVQNEAMMKRDVQLAGTINSVAFLLLFLCVSRDWRVAAVFLLPVATTGLTIGMCALFYPNLSVIMLSLCIAMAGSAVDYGIYVYTALRMGTNANAALRRIRRPLLISHLTTLGVFVAFLFSSIPAYRQLGVLTSISLIMSLLAAIFILPEFLKAGGNIVGLGRGLPLRLWGGKIAFVTVIAAVLLIAGIFVAARIGFDPDVTKLDGASADVKQAEIDFQKNWGRTDTQLAILVVTGKTREQAEQANDDVYRIVNPHFPDGQFNSLSSFRPSDGTRRANQARWRQFWSAQRITALKSDLASAAAPFGFSTSAFDPFFRSLAGVPAKEQPQPILSMVEDQFTAHSKNGDWQMLNYLEDTPANAATVLSLLSDRPDAQLISRGVLTRAFKQSAVSETRVLVSVSFVFIAVSLLVLTRSVVKSLIIMLPVLTGLVAMLAVLHMMSLSISIITVVATIIVLALTSDYGVFAVYAWEGGETIMGQGLASVHLSFWTTLVGTGAMIFARHPALFIIGVSLTSGLVAGYLTSFLVIPGICHLWDASKSRRAI